MKPEAFFKMMLAGLVASLLSGSIALARDGIRTTARAPARSASAARVEAARQSVQFQTGNTDSWLCTHVSPFFCSNLFPTLSPSAGENATSKVPDRSRQSQN